MGWRFASGGHGFTAIGSVDSSAEAPLGTIVTAQHSDYGMGEFIYLQGVASTATGSWVVYNADAYTTVLLARDATGPVAVAMGATVANKYGWYQIGGEAYGKGATDIADSAEVFSSTTTGTVDDAASAGNRVYGALTAGTYDTSTSLVKFDVHRPSVDDTVDT